MATQRDAERLALKLPETMIRSEKSWGISVIVKGKERGICWLWKERIDPKKPRVPNPKVLAVRTADLDEKDALLASDPDVFFTEPHYNGYPAVLVRLDAIDTKQLRAILERAHEGAFAKATGRSRRPSRTRSRAPAASARGRTPRPRR
ncbi:MAG TPA: hypothetical protein VL463_21080 [Kofleriaceae bacterium]|jgi:hypothetical protein|nr:hypothetical protein [Kofleriaceae bacterium]